MSERTFERLVTVVLLGLGLWYLGEMLSYGDAGRIPAIVAAVMVAAALVQLLLSFRRNVAGGAPDAAEEPLPGAGGAPAVLEPDSYDTLIRLQGRRRRQFLTIALWAVLFYVGSLAVGFVITFTVLFAALLLVVRERLWLTAVVAVVTAASVYAFVTVFLDLPAFRGFLLD